MSSELKPLDRQRRLPLAHIFETVEVQMPQRKLLEYHGIGRIIQARANGYTELEIANEIGVSAGTLRRWLKDDSDRRAQWNETVAALGMHLMQQSLEELEEDFTIPLQEADGEEVDKQDKVMKGKLRQADLRIKTKQELAKTMIGQKPQEEESKPAAPLVIVGVQVNPK